MKTFLIQNYFYSNAKKNKKQTKNKTIIKKKTDKF